IFTPHAPGDGKYADTLLAGIRLRVTDRTAYDPALTAIHLLAAVIARHGGNDARAGRRFAWLPSFTRLAGTDALQKSLEAGASPEAATAGWDAARRQFLERSEDVLLYLRP
ncbi:MAG: exo-beta-N-acetylmuramidase NamZ family protein, partial [Gemmatimonadales bacterium]